MSSNQKWCNVGFGFVNFKSPDYATAFSEAFENYPFSNGASMKFGHTKPATHQGYQANMAMNSCHLNSVCLLVF